MGMRRKAGVLIAIEESLLAAAMHLRSRGDEEFHGFRIAKEVKGQKDARLLTGHGTLYRALGRLEREGYLGSRWEDPLIGARENRPRRKLYKLTATGITAGAAATSDVPLGSDGSESLNPVWTTLC